MVRSERRRVLRASQRERDVQQPSINNRSNEITVVQKLRPFLGLFALLSILLLAGWQFRGLLQDKTIWPPDDYVEYWAAGHLNWHGQNPYSPELLLPLQQDAGRDTDEAIMMWNPPWTLSFVMPLGTLDARVGQFLWLFLHIGILGYCAYELWRIYGGKPEQRWIAFALTATFMPTWMVLHVGQIGPLLLLGAVWFIKYADSKFAWLAGAAAVLMAIKPHLVYLLWLAVLFDGIQKRSTRIILGGILGGIITTAIPMAFNPDLWDQYFAAYRDHPPAQWVSLTIGVVLRKLFAEDAFWLQFPPMLLGISWFLWHWKQHGRDWNWAEQLPILVIVSFVTAPYGAWHFDLVLLLLPVLHRGARLTQQGWTTHSIMGVTVLALMNLAMLLMIRVGVWSWAFCWVAPLTLLLYWWTNSTAVVESNQAAKVILA